MTTRSYPTYYLETISSEQSAEAFADHILSLRSYLLRIMLIFTLFVTAWRINSGFAPYADTLVTSWFINVSAVTCLLASFSWPFGHPMKNLYVRYGFCLLWFVASLMLISSAGYAPLWSFCAILCCLIIAGDDPDHHQAWRRWFGTLLAFVAIIIAFVILASDWPVDNPKIFNRWQIGFATIVAVTSYAWHGIFSNQQLLHNAADPSAQWHQMVLRLRRHYTAFDPLFLILVVTALVFALSISSIITSPEQSIFVTMLTQHRPFSVLLLVVFVAIFIAATREHWLQAISPWVFAASFGLAGFMIFNVGVNQNAGTFFAPMGFLYFLQPNASRQRWLVPALYACLLLVAVSKNFVEYSLEFLLICWSSFFAFAAVFDQLRMQHLKQLAVLEHLDEGVDDASIPAADVDKFDQWILSNKWLGITSLACVIIAFAIYSSQQSLINTEIDVLHGLVEKELDYEIRRQTMQLNFLAQDDDNDMFDALTRQSVWCAVWRSSEPSGVPAVSNCPLDIVWLRQSFDGDLSTTLPIFFVKDHRVYMVLRSDLDDALSVYGVLDVAVWIKANLHVSFFNRPYQKQLLFDDAISDLRWSIDIETLQLSSLAPSVNLDSSWSVQIRPSDEISSNFWLETGRLLIIFCLFIAGLRHIYVSRYNVTRLSTDVAQQGRQLEENNRLRQEIADALYRAEEANKSKDNFLGMIGHEIRTPLNSVMGMLQALNLKPLPQDAKHLVKNAYSASTMLLNLVNDVLDYNKMKSGTLTLAKHTFALGPLIDLYHQQYATTASQKGLNFKCDIIGDRDVFVLGDDIRLGQVLTNLLSNAVKFTESGGIFLHVEITVDGDDVTCLFKVMDTGIGIDHKFLPLVFEPFKQYDMSMKREYRGSGLGLSIVKHLAEMMHGHVDVFSRVGRGSTFVFRVTLERALEQPSIASANELDVQVPKAIYKGKRILVVDDDPLNLEVIKELLEPFGVTVDCAQNSRQSLAFVKQHASDYQFVLMDHQMPDMTGLEQTYRLRETYDSNTLPIILLTADLSEKVLDLAEKAGTNESVSKPITLSNLRRLLDTY